MSLRASNPALRADNSTLEDLALVMPKNCESKEGTLHLAGVDLFKLAKELGTALYVYDEDMIESNILRYKQGLESKLPSAQVCYASKAFICKDLLKMLARHGLYLDVCGGAEIYMAQLTGFPTENLVFHGNNKTPQEIREAIDAGVGKFVVDTKEELDRISEAAYEMGVNQKVLLRITPGIVADTHSFIQTGSEDSKFGFTIAHDTAKDAVAHALSLPHLKLMGFHMHIGSQIFNLEGYSQAISVMVDFIKDIYEQMDYLPEEFDVGGGLGIAYTVHDKPTSIEQFCDYIGDELLKGFNEAGLELPKIYIEPGRSIIGNAGITLYSVGSVKEIPGVRTYVNVDGGMSDNIRTALYGAEYEGVIVNKADELRSELVTVAGKHCESGDVLIVDGSLQEAEVGDVLAIFATGAYCESMSSNYNMQTRPAVVFVRVGSYHTVKRRETYKDLLAREL